MTEMLGAAATAYGLGAALSSLLQAKRMRHRQTSADVSLGFLSSYIGGYAVWLTYGVSIGSLPLIVVDAVGLGCGGATLLVALRLRAATGTVAATRKPTPVDAGAAGSRVPSLFATSFAALTCWFRG
ncbi:MAG TPA: hypothetical protein VK919_10830 [Solirubrobacterales bacterium]|nr:hypothetical protein [Solirubrobacterales bacterium]